MICFFAPETTQHDPQFFLMRGMVSPNNERAERAELLLQGLTMAGLTPHPPAVFPDAVLTQVHTPRYVDFLRTAYVDWQSLPDAGGEVVANVHPVGRVRHYPGGIVARAGWHMADTACPIGPHTWTAARRAADTALAAAQGVADGAPAAYALCRPPGHHAMAEIAGGHCFLNNAAIAAQHLRATHDRVAVLDIDVHHGNGTQDIFYDRGDVLTVSVHAETDGFYPFFTGYDDEIGTGAGSGANLNIALPRHGPDAPWLAAIDGALDRIKTYDPGVLVLSLGLDAHVDDPFQGLSISTQGFTAAAQRIKAAQIPTVIIQEGGYVSPHLSLCLCAFMIGWTTV